MYNLLELKSCLRYYNSKKILQFKTIEFDYGVSFKSLHLMVPPVLLSIGLFN